jgi:hypothetical protein
VSEPLPFSPQHTARVINLASVPDSRPLSRVKKHQQRQPRLDASQPAWLRAAPSWKSALAVQPPPQPQPPPSQRLQPEAEVCAASGLSTAIVGPQICAQSSGEPALALLPRPQPAPVPAAATTPTRPLAHGGVAVAPRELHVLTAELRTVAPAPSGGALQLAASGADEVGDASIEVLAATASGPDDVLAGVPHNAPLAMAVCWLRTERQRLMSALAEERACRLELQRTQDDRARARRPHLLAPCASRVF